jgi:hypothetical protein
MMRFLIDDCVLGLAAYAACAAFLLLAVFKRFANATGRLPLPGMERRIYISVSSPSRLGTP